MYSTNYYIRAENTCSFKSVEMYTAVRGSSSATIFDIKLSLILSSSLFSNQYRYTCLSPPVISADRSQSVLLLWINFVVCVSCLFLLCCLVCFM